MLHNGVPYDVAVNLEDADLLAYCIVFGEIQGRKWDWHAMQWSADK